MMTTMTLEKFEEACEIVGRVTNKTGLVYSQCFSDQCGNKVYLKPENMQKTGASRSEVLTIRSAPCLMRTERRD